MNYTKPKEKVLDEIRVNAFTAVSRNMGNLGNAPMTSVAYMIQSAITEGIVEAFKTMMNNTYTDQQFEEDTKLNS
jgi:hypothetical protein